MSEELAIGNSTSWVAPRRSPYWLRPQMRD